MNAHNENLGKTVARVYPELCTEHSIELILYQVAIHNG